MKEKVIFIGAGGYAKSVLDSLDQNRFELIGFVDNFKPIDSVHLGYPILADNIDNLANKEQYSYFICIGNNEHRLQKFTKLQKYNCNIINVIDKNALISSNTTLGVGVFIGKMAIINSDVIIGDNAIINTKALIEHGCRVGTHTNISTNTTLNGDVIVEDYCFIGSSSVVTGQIRVGESAIVGAGSVVIRNVSPRTVVAGVPAKFIKEVN